MAEDEEAILQKTILTSPWGEHITYTPDRRRLQGEKREDTKLQLHAACTYTLLCKLNG